MATRAWQRLMAVLPQGQRLPTRDWERRHHGMLLVLWAHAAGIFLYVLLREKDLLHGVVEGGAVALAGLLASWPRAGRRFAANAACVGLLTSSGIMVHLSGGYIEMHFHFFVMVPLMALYQDWVPFLTAIAYVVLHHGTVGVLDPGQVYNHASAWASPWTWAAIHGIFIVGTSVVSCITWRLNELASADAAASSQRFRDLVQTLDTVVWEADPDMERFTFMSRQGETVYGIPAERWLEERGLWKSLIAADDRERTLDSYAAHIAGGAENQIAYKVVINGRVIHVSDIVHVVRDEAGQARQLRGVTVDTTDRRVLEEQLRQSQKMDAIGRLAGGIAHDFNNLLSVIIGRTAMLKEENTAWAKPLALIESTAQRAADLTRQLLALGRKQVLQPRVLDLGEVVRNLAPILRRVIREDVELAVEVVGDGGHVETDPVQLEQVILNLAVNARDAMPAGGRTSIQIASVELDGRPDGRRIGAPAGPYVALRVTDTGVGMDEATLLRIFEPFFTTKEVGKGTGLGLATVYGIVTQSNGDIRVNSSPGRGTSFTVYLPRVPAPAAPPASAAGPEQRATGTETILLVEDQAEVRALVEDVLTGRGYRVLTAGGPVEALRLAAETTEPIDVLLTDVVMPEMSGLALAERLTADHPRMKVLYMSGYSDEVVDGHVVPGALLSKPFTPHVLMGRLKDVLSGSATSEHGAGVPARG